MRSIASLAVVAIAVATAAGLHVRPGWSKEERATLHSLSLSSLGPLPADPSNRYADDPRAASLGEALFFDTRLSGNGKVSCATCHVPAQDFQDGTPLAHGVGTTTRRTMPIAGSAYGAWFFWDGRADSQWAQALGPLESAVEHGGTRTQYAHVIADAYRDRYETVFGPMPRLAAARPDDISRIYANIGKAIAAYERRLPLAPTRFDRWVDAELAGRAHTPESTLSSDELAGLRLFIGKGSCVNCHNGPRFTDDHFHNTGVPNGSATADSGRAVGVRQALANEFSCTGPYSDAHDGDCDELRFATAEGEALVRAYKTPSLRGVAERAPYMHAGQIATLADVIAHYDRAPRAPFGHSELKSLQLTSDERRQIETFLRTLSARRTTPASAPTRRDSR